MSVLIVAAETFRRAVNDHEYADRLESEPQRWQQLCAAMDTLTDSAMAAVAFAELPSSKDKSELYLRAFGILQCLHAQQAAIMCAAGAIGLDHLLSDDFAELREVRNATIAHAPLKNRGNLHGSFGIVQLSLTALGFEWFPFDFETFKSGSWPRQVVFAELLYDQERAVCDAVARLIEGMG